MPETDDMTLTRRSKANQNRSKLVPEEVTAAKDTEGRASSHPLLAAKYLAYQDSYAATPAAA
ncbi:hypothetical protein BN1723_008798, partial [Verticillium longisporum]